jgi:ribonuclease P protein component
MLDTLPNSIDRRAGFHEADVQAAQPEARKQARVSCSHEHEGGPQDAGAPPREGPAPARRAHRLQVDAVTAEGAREPGGVPGPPQLPTGQRLPRAARVRLANDIRKLLREGTRRKTSHLDVFFMSGPDEHPRFGLIVPKHRHTGVERNRLKRRLREAGRRDVLPRLRDAGAGLDFLVRARREAYGARYSELKEEMVEVTEALCSDPSLWR